MKVGDKAIIISDKTRWCEGTEVIIKGISRFMDDPKPVFVRQVHGTLNCWVGFEDLKELKGE